MNRRTPLALLALPLLLTLAACTVTANRTLPADTVAGVAAGALEDQYDIVVDSMDCGEESVAYVVGTTVDCVVTVDGDTSDATVTITSIDGDDYKVGVDVPQASWLLGGAPDPGADGDTLTVYAYELADTAEGALESTYGARPTITCEGDTIEISVGTEIECDLIEAKTGGRGIATITVTSIEGSEYGINVTVVDA